MVHCARGHSEVGVITSRYRQVRSLEPRRQCPAARTARTAHDGAVVPLGGQGGEVPTLVSCHLSPQAGGSCLRHATGVDSHLR